MKANPTTAPKTKLGTEYTQEIDKVITEEVFGINKKLMDNKKMLNEKYVSIKVGKDVLRLKSDTNMNDLKKWKNEFQTMNKLNPFKTTSQALEGFVYFLQNKMK